MRNVARFLEGFYTQELKITKGAKGETIHQTQRNKVKAELMNAIFADLAEELDIDVVRTADGIAFLLDNEEQGGVPVVLDTAMKSFNYDIFIEAKNHEAEVERKAAEAEKRAKAKRIKFENDKLAREMNKVK